MDMKVSVTRRTVIRTMAGAGGMLLGFRVPGAVASVIAPRPWTASDSGDEINAWLAINGDGTVTVRVPHTEQGQGALTSVATMVAEELDVPWDTVRAVFADMNRHVNEGEEYVVTSTFGSAVVRERHPHIMQAGASARERLKVAAARSWGVDAADVVAKQGILTSGIHRSTYGEFATAAAEVTLSREPAIKAPQNWWLLGKSTPRLDAAVKVDGSAHYSIDTRLEGMVYAAVKCCPVPWGGLRNYDFDVIKDRPGVLAAIEFQSVEGKTGNSDMQNGVAVVAGTWHRAKTALDLMPVEWQIGPEGEVSNEAQGVQARRHLEQTGVVSHETGTSAIEMVVASERKVVANYHRPFEAHMRMEPANATVSVTDERVDVWSPTQNQASALRLVADQLGRDPREVFVHTGFLGGAFGGGGSGSTAVTRQAAEISRRMGRPAKVIWTREEDVIQDKQRPPVYSRLSASLGERGLPDAFFSRTVWFTHEGAGLPSDAPADVVVGTMPYAIPNRRHEVHHAATHIPTSTHRAPVANQNGFMMESFVDEMALASGWDPLEWRLEMTKGKEAWQRVLLKLQEVSGFLTDLPQGEGMGIAVVEDHGSICAACATVSVTRSGRLSVEKVVLVLNSGYVINPRAAAEQIEGSVGYELSHALYGGLRLADGQFVTRNFDTYQLLRMPEMPEVEVHYALSRDGWWGGVGEPGGPPIPPAVSNAIYFATGKRIRSTPISRHDLSWA